MSAPQTPPPDRRNTAAVGCLVFVGFNVIAFAAAASAVRTPFAGLLRSMLLLGNLVIPVVALVKGWGRFAAGWAIAIGVVIVGLAGLCFYALGSMH